MADVTARPLLKTQLVDIRDVQCGGRCRQRGVGFYSHSHFSTAFKQAYGRSPSSFRSTALQR